MQKAGHAHKPEEYLARGAVGRHETFTPRYGWLKKGYEGVCRDGGIFKDQEAVLRLGVGKNMVSSIRFWCQAFKLVEPGPQGGVKPAPLGERLLPDRGWDPYLEDVASLWLLHWQLFIPRLEAISWPLAFYRCNLWTFDIQQLKEIIYREARQYPRFAGLSPKTFERDASCLIRMYARETGEKDSEILCPFTQLGVMRKAAERNQVSFDTGPKQGLPALVFAAACFSFGEHYLPPGQKTVSLQRLAYDFTSPGTAFKVSESQAGAYLEEAARQMGGFNLVDYLGGQQLHLDKPPAELYWQALEKYYS